MKRKIYMAIAVIAVVTLISGATILATASPGTSSDPLITLSYLNGPFRALIESDIATALSRLTTRITNAENKITNELNTARTATANTFKYTSIANGASLTLPAGSEVMLRSGTVALSSGTLIRNTGTPGEVTSGNLAVNNMYIADGQVKLTASGGAANLWVRTDSSVILASVEEPEDTQPAAMPDSPPESDSPAEPAQPSEPDIPSEPETPAESETPADPETPAQPGDTGNLD